MLCGYTENSTEKEINYYEIKMASSDNGRGVIFSSDCVYGDAAIGIID